MSEKIAVIGGGLAGAAAAHTLAERNYDVTIIEQRDYLGGRVHSQLVDGAAVEMGAGFLTKDYTNVLDFMSEHGLDKRLYRQQGSSALLRDGSIRMVTPGALAGSELLSWGAKAQALSLSAKTAATWRNLDLHAFWKAEAYDRRSVADMFTSKAGKEFLEYAVQPALNGYFYWTPEQTSEAMLRILCKTAFSHGTYKMKGGLQRIPEKAAETSKTLLGHTAKQIGHTASGAYEIQVEHEGQRKVILADGIVCATTASAVPNLFPHLNERQRQFFAAIRYSSAALLARTYLQQQTRGDKAIAFPRTEGTELASVTLSPEPGAGDVTYATVKTYASGASAAELAQLPDRELKKRLIAAMELAHDHVLVNNPQPVAEHLQRWREALPHFDVGHFTRLRQFEDGAVEDEDRALTFAGDYLGGPFMEGAFTSGVKAAERLNARLRRR